MATFYTTQQSTYLEQAASKIYLTAIANGYAPAAGFSAAVLNDILKADIACGLLLAMPSQTALAVTPTALSASTCAEQIVAVTGATVADSVLVTAPAAPTAATSMGSARVSSAGNVAVTWINCGAGTPTPASGSYTFRFFRNQQNAQASQYREAAASRILDVLLAYGYVVPTNYSGAVGNDILLRDAIANLLACLPVQVAVAITPVATSANTTAEQTFTVTGALVGDGVIVTPPAGPTAGTFVGQCRVSAANTVAIAFGNMTAGSLTAASGTYTFRLFRS